MIFKVFRHSILTIVWVTAIIIAVIYTVPHIPYVQNALGNALEGLLSEKLATRVEVGKVNVRLPNRLVIDDVALWDQNRKEMLRAGRISASVELLPLLYNKYIITSAQIFGAKVNLYQSNSSSPLNCQFVIDSLSSKNDNKEHTPLDLQISSLQIRNSEVNYDRYDVPQRSDRFSPQHLALTKLSSNIVVEHITDNTVSVVLKKLTVQEKSGLQIDNLAFAAEYSQEEKGATKGTNIKVTNFILELPDSKVTLPKALLSYTSDNNGIISGSLKHTVEVHSPHFSAADLSPLLPEELKGIIPATEFNVNLNGSDKQTSAVFSLHSLDGRETAISTSAEIYNLLNTPSADILVSKCHIPGTLVSRFASVLSLPEQLLALGDIDLKGRTRMLSSNDIELNTLIKTSRAGDIDINGTYDSGLVHANIATERFALGNLLPESKLGNLACTALVDCDLKDGRLNLLTVKGSVPLIEYSNQPYTNISLDASYHNTAASQSVNGTMTIKDPQLSFESEVNLQNLSLDNIMGFVKVHNLDAHIDNKSVQQKEVSFSSTKHNNQSVIEVTTDFATLVMQGKIQLSTLDKTFSRLLAQYLPSLPGLNSYKAPFGNDFSINMHLEDINLIKKFIDLPLDILKPVDLSGYVSERSGMLNIGVDAPLIEVSDKQFTNTQFSIWTPRNELKASLETFLKSDDEKLRLNLDCTAVDDSLLSRFTWDNLRENTFRGDVSLLTNFHGTVGHKGWFDVSIPDSKFEVGDTVWDVHSKDITYNNGKLTVSQLTLENDDQYFKIDGIASSSPSDTIRAELHNLDIGYILDLVNFESVEFDGKASGLVYAQGVMDDIEARAQLNVQQFLFEQGRMGTLHIDANYNNKEKQINIDAECDDPDANAVTYIDGYVSPEKNFIDLAIKADNSRMEFMQSFCSSFVHDVDLHGTGNARLFGPLNAINLTGKIVTDGQVTLTPTNCRYTLTSDTITFVPDDIQFNRARITDKYGNEAFVTGGIHHHNLGRMSYDLQATSEKFLAYDEQEFGDNPFCGMAIVKGDIGVHGLGNELTINAEVTALKDSYISYNVTSADAITNRDFITWNSASAPKSTYNPSENKDVISEGASRTNIRMNFLVNVNPDARLHLIMDQNTGDYINLFGNADLHVSYYNKGAFNIHGNYEIENGIYHMTIQNIISKDFQFLKGSTIAFGGNPFDALLQMKALYALNSVPLSDLNIGSSFKTNNVPVNCLMNISGTAGKPVVDFDLELPSLSNDAQQMIHSIINSGEQMNQQVLYLLAIGRFYSDENLEQGSAGSGNQGIGQGTLALQSFLSGTLSQQFNSMMSKVMGQLSTKNKWTFGANVATGNEGMSNAEYEGLLSGSLFNNRLLFDGQFGYRDNINTDNQNFIGDFTITYLLTPTGTVALKAYNQTNDRYFTKNSLNTQGVGIVFQKEFESKKKKKK